MALPLLSLRATPPPPREPGPQQHVGRNRNLLMLTAWGCLVVTGQYALVAFLALDLNEGSGLTLAEASIFVAVANVAGIIGRVLWGLVSDKHRGGSRKAYLLTINAVGLIGARAALRRPAHGADCTDRAHRGSWPASR